MSRLRLLTILVPLLAVGSALGAQVAQVAPVTPNCPSCAEWNAPQAPFKLVGNTFYVGTHGLTALLITSPSGHILIDGGLMESAPLIAANIRTLGFRLEDVRVLLNTHVHYDHAGGLAALQRLSGAEV